MTNEQKREIYFKFSREIVDKLDSVPVLMIVADSSGRLAFVPAPNFKLALLPAFLNEAAEMVNETLAAGN